MTGARIITRLQWTTAACCGAGVLVGIGVAVAVVRLGLPGKDTGWAFVMPHLLGVLGGLIMAGRQLLILRRARRAAFLLCDNCLYPVGGLTVCPECGNDVTLAPQRWKVSAGRTGR